MQLLFVEYLLIIFKKYQVKALDDESWLINLPEISLNISDEAGITLDYTCYHYRN